MKAGSVKKEMIRSVSFVRKKTMFVRQRFFPGEPIFIHILKCGGSNIEAALRIPKTHDTALTRRRRVGIENWNSSFTFSMVRHPYSRVISYYRYRKKHDETGVRSDRVTLNDWIMRTCGERDPRYYDRALWFAPCKQWLSDRNGKLLVKYVAKFETIDTDWLTIQDRIGRSRKLPYQHMAIVDSEKWDLLTPDSKTVINEHFQEDFEAFDYVPE